MAFLWINIMMWCTISMSMVFPAAVHSAPITIDFSTCRASEFPGEPVQCCPILPTNPIIDGLPLRSTNFTRTRLAAQCTDANYAAQLARGYDLMRALPDSDPRSFTQQWFLHCSYCGGAFVTQDSNTNTTRGIDIHFSWLFFPWHRYFLYFHERILQSLLGDPSFSLSYWNWDSPYTVGSRSNGGCYLAGHNFPSAYSDSSRSTYDTNRSDNAKGLGRLPFPDLAYEPQKPAVDQTLYNASADTVINSNLNIVYQAMVIGGTTAESFMGRPYRAGDVQGVPNATGGGGNLELTSHAGAHFWTGRDASTGDLSDMGALPFSARDPVFYAHHSNIDRLWTVWRDLGRTTLDQDREYFSDPDFLDATFLFYDENSELRRVRVGDALESENLGYVYQQTNDLAWININKSSCSALNHSEVVAQAQSLPTPRRDDSGYYSLQADATFTLVVDYPAITNGSDVFLTIDGIQLNRSLNDGFDVFLDWIDPTSRADRGSCSESIGRFINMAQGARAIIGNETLLWQTSISSTLTTLEVPESASDLVVTIVPLTLGMATTYAVQESITFSSITVGASS